MASQRQEKEVTLTSYASYRSLCSRLADAAQGMRFAGHEVHVHSVCYGTDPAGTKITPHRHSYCEAIVIVSGKAQETAGFKGQLQAGTLQFHPPGSRHGWKAPDAPLARFAVFFSIHPVPRLKPLEEWPLVPEAVTDVNDLLKAARSTDPGAANCMHARLVLLLSRFFALLDWPKKGVQTESPHTRSLGEIVDAFLRDNLAEAISLHDVALVANVSIPTLTASYRQETGTTVMKRLNTLRLEEAARLLRETEQPVKEIAKRVGFSDPSYFCRLFRRRLDCAPGEYARKQRSLIQETG